MNLWENIDNGLREPVEVIYIAMEDIDLSEIVDWGIMTEWWGIRIVSTAQEALLEHSKYPCDVMIMLGGEIGDAELISSNYPQLPISIAHHGGFDRFPEGWPAQVVVAQWAAPRPTEFGDALETALGEDNIEIIYQANRLSKASDLSLIAEVNGEFLKRLSEFPEDRFIMNPRLFEETVAELLFRMGYEVNLTPKVGDKGRDIIAKIDMPTSPILMLVECKRYAPHRLVGPEPITRLWFRMFDDHANMAMVVTTSGFQPITHSTARDRGYQISLKDGEDFIEWIRSLKIT